PPANNHGKGPRILGPTAVAISVPGLSPVAEEIDVGMVRKPKNTNLLLVAARTEVATALPIAVNQWAVIHLRYEAIRKPRGIGSTQRYVIKHARVHVSRYP